MKSNFFLLKHALHFLSSDINPASHIASLLSALQQANYYWNVWLLNHYHDISRTKHEIPDVFQALNYKSEIPDLFKIS